MGGSTLSHEEENCNVQLRESSPTAEPMLGSIALVMTSEQDHDSRLKLKYSEISVINHQQLFMLGIVYGFNPLSTNH